MLYSTDRSKTKGKKEKVKENPFSFKKFLSAPERPSKTDTLPSRTIPPDIATDVPLFVNEHFTDSHQEDYRASSSLGGRVPPLDSLEDSDNFSDSKQTVGGASGGAAAFVSDNGHFHDADVDSDSIHTSSGLHLGLPDFLSDGAILNTVSHDGDISPERCRSRSRDHDEDLHSQIRIVSCADMPIGLLK